MNILHKVSLASVVAGCLAVSGGNAFAQATQLENGFRNSFSEAGPPETTSVLIPTEKQWESGTAFGGEAQKTPDAPAAGYQIKSSRLGRPMVLRSVALPLGTVLTRPELKPDGSPIPASDPDYYLPEPANADTGNFYWSKHAGRVYATEPGTIEVVWELRVPEGATTTHSTFVTVSGSPAKTPRKIFWTERDFNGPTVLVPTGRVRDVAIVYTANFPRFAYGNLYDVIEGGEEAPAPVTISLDEPFILPAPSAVQPQTLWAKTEGGQLSLHAYNLEGRVFIELLGNTLGGSGNRREHLGFEIVDVVKEVRPTDVRVAIGDRVWAGAPDSLDDAARSLEPRVVAGLQGDEFLFDHTPADGTGEQLYAIRETNQAYVVDRDGDGELDEQQGNEVLVYWMETGEMDIRWPRRYSGYIFKWPEEFDHPDGSAPQPELREEYTLYVRATPEDGENPADTYIALDPDNRPELVYQDASAGDHASFDITTNRFFTTIGTGSRSLLRFTRDDQVWFERIYSIENSEVDGYSATPAATIGSRIEPPDGAEELVGYIRQTSGTAFDPTAYIDPFVSGFDAAKLGAIIPVNALPDNDILEVWWYQKSTPPADSSFTSAHWPSLVQRYQLSWPLTDPDDDDAYDTIVMARNDGSGDLGIAASGTIYRQPDADLPGYNPNEEHALMSGGVAWALRDDLNDAATTSAPFVLVRYTAEDGRPAMVTRGVVRENATHPFRYDVPAGEILQAPMPLPVMPLPFVGGEVANAEVENPPSDPPANFEGNEDGIEHYDRFTVTDRKGSTWIYRGPHAPDGSEKSFAMHYYYVSQESFDFPGQLSPPEAGAVLPYLSPRDGAGNVQTITGDVAATVPAEVTFVPQWPEDPPVLHVGETLGLPKRGLPAVRGQISAKLLYEQSVASLVVDRPRSAKLFDPTRAKISPLGSANSSQHLGKSFFPGLPPHLSRRLYIDPDIGAHGALVFVGEFVDAALGEDYFLPNVMSADDVAHAKGLVADADLDKAKWDQAIDRLSTAVETMGPKPNFPGQFEVDTTTAFGVTEPAEIFSDESPVDSYAISAAGGGTGYVTVVFGDGEAFVPEAAPVSMEIFKVEAPLYTGELKVIAAANPLDEKLTLRHSADFNGEPADYEFEWVTAQPAEGFPPANVGSSPWLPLPQDGPLHTIEGASIFTLTDNYFAVRYKAKPGTAAFDATGGDWSPWTAPQLAEGWIKRALAGINPFEQRASDLFSNAVNTDVSLLTQAGARWEGNIALNLDQIDDFGLIEIYQTILDRGEDLSISGAPPLNVPAANDALLLAAGHLNDLYMLLGNEAYADAANPTIAFDADGVDFGDFNTALFAFKGQMANVLDEELALLRGRDDNQQPGVGLAPVYNRLVWNFTGGITSGEPIYSLNYNISDQNDDGAADASDAALQFPQGHGDAYGHYLTALTGYYRLLANDNFGWTPRVEAVSVLGEPVTVDYQDERKFAAAGSALARTSAQVLDLTYRKDFAHDPAAGWSGLRDGEENADTGKTRHWGTDEWASRAGQGAFFHWVTANSILPAEDNANTGIEKVDRTTVPELDELVGQAHAVQGTLDQADARLNPLGLAKGALGFDIDPARVDAGETHYEQMADRAVKALKNAAFAFDNAKSSTAFLRNQENGVNDQRAAIEEQERVFENRLVELYGTPYADDIGPGRTYVQGYAGPDLVHYRYTDLPQNAAAEQTTVEVTHLLSGPDLNEVDTDGRTVIASIFGGSRVAGDEEDLELTQAVEISYTLDAAGVLAKPDEWSGRRSHPGQLQSASAAVVEARARLRRAADRYSAAGEEAIDLVTMANNTLARRRLASDLQTEFFYESNSFRAAIIGLHSLESYFRNEAETALLLGDIVAENFPLVVGFSNDITGPERALARFAGLEAMEGLRTIATGLKIGRITLQETLSILRHTLENDLEELAWSEEYDGLLHSVRAAVRDSLAELDALEGAAFALQQAEEHLRTLEARGLAIQSERETFRKRAAAIVQGYRTRDLAFRVFRDEALEKYKTLYDLAARYTYLAATAYDYETGLLDASGQSAAAGFLQDIVQSRALGVVGADGQPQYTASSTGDPGLAGVLAQLGEDWSVVESRLGFNNPDNYRTTFSLRGENYRIVPGDEGDGAWRDQLASHRQADILADPDVRRYALGIEGDGDGPVPGLVIPFSTSIVNGYNFFGQPLAGGDHTFSPSSFATKIRASGIAFKGYVGMDDPASNGGAVAGAGGASPPDPDLGFLDPDALSATPYIYLVPVGVDSMRSPPLGDTGGVRRWTVADQAIPLPFNIGNSDFADNSDFVSNGSLSEEPFAIRKHQAFRAVPSGTVFSSAPGFTNSRLIGRSVWNSQWKLVIPGTTLRSNAEVGLDVFLETVEDIELFLETYSYSGN